MAKTQEQIDRIHIGRTAVPGRIYTGPKNVLYSGSKLGHLVQEQTLHGDLVGSTLNNVIANIGDYSVEDLSEILSSIALKLDKTEFEEYKLTAASKCYAVAMAVAL